jgi:hypothetical protein
LGNLNSEYSTSLGVKAIFWKKQMKEKNQKRNSVLNFCFFKKKKKKKKRTNYPKFHFIQSKLRGPNHDITGIGVCMHF